MPQTPEVSRYVFVYGTLRRGGANDIHRFRPVPVFLGPADVAGTLYHLGAYPGLRLDGRGWVHGEVYGVTPEVERALDELEEVWPQATGEYLKRQIAVRVGDQTLDCIVYEISAERIAGCRVIASGDWIKDQ